MKRYLNSFKNIKKPFLFWSEYYRRKEKPETDYFDVILTGGLKVEIPNDLISAFDEVFLREVYHSESNASMNSAPLIIDIGANVGYFSLYAFKNFKNARVIAFEPFPPNFKLLDKHKAENVLNNLILDKRAVSGTDSVLKINYNPDVDYSVGASMVNRDGASSTLEVEAISLKDLFDQYKVEHCDLLKIDCEGAEYNILFNTPDDVYDCIDKIVIEMHEWVPKEEGTPDKLISFLEGKGFKVDFKSNWMLWAIK